MEKKNLLEQAGAAPAAFCGSPALWLQLRRQGRLYFLPRDRCLGELPRNSVFWLVCGCVRHQKTLEKRKAGAFVGEVKIAGHRFEEAPWDWVALEPALVLAWSRKVFLENLRNPEVSLWVGRQIGWMWNHYFQEAVSKKGNSTLFSK